MKKNETHERIITYYLEPHEIDQLILDKVSKEAQVGTKQFAVEFEINYEFVKEGSPEYNTRKIKCTVKIKHDLIKAAQPQSVEKTI